ncbi:hypothetical protein OG777_28750 [Micromonospora peucetia]|uniref:hypothetical protein n=1 Tax=Micromonospora peucetia TaxID=47871 RepID=UPI000B839FCE|nr:hypothetical protein [Micromonospora peucetia]MCX4390892.1 hypothetical protein [Micromonospora peucetia]
MAARRPLLVAGGGVIYSGATDALRRFVEEHGVPLAETQAVCPVRAHPVRCSIWIVKGRGRRRSRHRSARRSAGSPASGRTSPVLRRGAPR